MAGIFSCRKRERKGERKKGKTNRTGEKKREEICHTAARKLFEIARALAMERKKRGERGGVIQRKGGQ